MTECLKKIWQRARSPEQKQERVTAILAAAARLYDRCSWDEITLVEIGQEAGFTRSNLYKYFQTKEEIFLELMKEDLSAWRRQMEERLAGLTPDTSAFAAAWVELLLANRRMTKFMAILATTLERNVPIASLAAYKIHLLAEFTRVAEAIMGLFPGLNLEQVTTFIWAHFAYSVGMSHLLAPSDLQQRAMAEAGIHCSEKMLRTVFIEGIAALFDRFCPRAGGR